MYNVMIRKLFMGIMWEYLMKRNIFNKLNKWRTAVGRKPLVLFGARQVGKTFSLKQFGTQCFSHMLYLNFEEEPKIHSLFSGSLNPHRIIKNLEIYFNKTIDAKNTLIIFD